MTGGSGVAGGQDDDGRLASRVGKKGRENPTVKAQMTKGAGYSGPATARLGFDI